MKNEIAGHLRREYRTIEAMIRLWCRGHHGSAELCVECEELRAYAEQRLIHCPFGSDKPICANCKVHCYKPDMRERVRVVMRESGPRMLLHHPILALLHLWLDARRPAPDKPQSRRSAARPA